MLEEENEWPHSLEGEAAIVELNEEHEQDYVAAQRSEYPGANDDGFSAARTAPRRAAPHH